MTEPRAECIALRVTRAQKRRLRRLAHASGMSVSAFVLRALEGAEAIPREAQRSAPELPPTEEWTAEDFREACFAVYRRCMEIGDYCSALRALRKVGELSGLEGPEDGIELTL